MLSLIPQNDGMYNLFGARDYKDGESLVNDFLTKNL